MAPAGLAGVALFLSLIMACTTVGPGPGPGDGTGSVLFRDTPPPILSNVLVYRGWRVGVPDDWAFYPRTDNLTGVEIIHFADAGAGYHGALELLSFDRESTGLTPERFLADLELTATARSTRISTARAEGPVVPGADTTLSMLALEEYDGDRLQAVTVLLTGDPGEGGVDLRPVAPDLDAVVIRVHQENPGTPRGFPDFAALARAIVSGVYPVGPHLDGRYPPVGPVFTGLSGAWEWLIDVPGGFMVYRATGDGRGLTAGIWREVPGVQTTRFLAESYDEALPAGTERIGIGPAIREFSYDAFLRPGNFAALGRALFITGSFDHRGDTWGIFLREQLTADQEPGPAAASELLSGPEIQELFAMQITPIFDRELVP
jgi:hypothetical protein